MVVLLWSPAKFMTVPRAEDGEALARRSLPLIVMLIVPRDQLILVAVVMVEEETFVESLVAHSLFPTEDAVREATPILLEVNLVSGRAWPCLVQVELQWQERYGYFSHSHFKMQTFKPDP